MRRSLALPFAGRWRSRSQVAGAPVRWSLALPCAGRWRSRSLVAGAPVRKAALPPVRWSLALPCAGAAPRWVGHPAGAWKGAEGSLGTTRWSLRGWGGGRIVGRSAMPVRTAEETSRLV